MTITTRNANLQFFQSSGTQDHLFSRSINTIIINTSDNTTSLSFDGYSFMPLAQQTVELYVPPPKQIYFTGSGTRSGWGFAR